MRFVGGDEVVLREPNRLALVDGGHVIRAVLFHVNRALILVAVPACQFDGLASVEREHAVFQRTVHLDLERSVSAFDGAQIAGVVFRDGLHSGPFGIVIGDVDVLHGGQIHHAHLVMR